jgi:chromosomal replication initiation ATPase DnaA
MKHHCNNLSEIVLFIEDFKREFRDKFDIDPKVLWSYNKEQQPPKIDLRILEQAANSLLEDDIFVDGIKSKSRRKEVVMLRQCMFKIARESGYTLTSIGSYFDYDHATILYSVTHVNNLLKTKDKLTIVTLHKLQDVLEKQFRNDGDVQHDVEEGSNSQ